jgi:hypothetical protein
MSHLRKGDVVRKTVGHRQGPKTHQLVVFTPCCNVRYHIDVEHVEWLQRTGNDLILRCGKRRTGRGNQPGQPGCGWPYSATLIKEKVGGWTYINWKV